ncbi:MAG: ribosome small subunit-dependent GTPase A, partial [Bdellovibrionota bacterium]
KQTLLANANAVVLVTSFNDDLNLRRLERGVAMIEDGGAKPVIVVNKYDLVNVEQATQIMNELSERFREVQIFAVSAHKGVGLVELTDSIHPGQSIAFLGMSGVGKSTLVNAILGSDKLETSAIREEDSRGRHTTTHRELVQTIHGFWLLDSPGLREFSLTDEGDGLDRTFQD